MVSMFTSSVAERWYNSRMRLYGRSLGSNITEAGGLGCAARTTDGGRSDGTNELSGPTSQTRKKTR
jgi:hypothetical protein